MNVARLRLENFKRHVELEMELVPGLNIVRGPNEAGKTTVQRALEMALFRRPTSSSQDLDESRPWRDGEADPVVELDFDEDGVTGTLRKVFAGQRGTVELRVGDETFNDPATVEGHIARLTGLPSEKFFRASASVHHQELAGLTEDEGTLRDRLQQSMSGADRGTHNARRKLEEAIRRYKSEGAKNPGYLKAHRSEVERLREQVRWGEAALTALESDRRAVADARAQRATLDAQLAEQYDGLKRAERAVELHERVADATRRYTMYKRAAELRAEIDKLESSHPSSVALPTLKATVERLRDTEFRLSEMRAEMAAEPDLSGFDVYLTAPRWRPWAFMGVALLLGAVLAGAAGVAVAGPLVGVIAAALLAVLGVVCIWRSLGLRQKLSDIRMQNELRESEIARRLAGRTDLAERVDGIEKERTDALAALGSADLARAEKLLGAETEHSAQISTYRAEYRGLMGDEPTTADMGELRDAAAAEADECRHALAGMGDLATEPEKHLAGFQLAVRRLTPEREAALQAHAQAEAKLAANEVDAEKVAADAEALEAGEEQLAAAERRLRIYEDVLATLNGAERATMKKAARFLEQRMARDVERITGGRYRRLKVDEATLTFSVFSVEANDWVDVRRLSQGTLDQLYLCARLGIVRQVTQPANPPLVFDDPLITFDDDRARRALALLKDISRDHQVIYLTTSDRYDAMADKVITLSAPTERDEQESLASPGPVETLTMWSTSAVPRARPLAKPLAANGDGNGNGKSSGNGHAPATPRALPEAAEPEPIWPVEDR